MSKENEPLKDESVPINPIIEQFGINLHPSWFEDIQNRPSQGDVYINYGYPARDTAGPFFWNPGSSTEDGSQG